MTVSDPTISSPEPARTDILQEPEKPESSPMEGRAKVTKDVLTEEARFILANVMAEAKYGRQNRYDDIRRVCEGAVSIPFAEYIGFLEKSGYLRHDRESETLEVTEAG